MADNLLKAVVDAIAESDNELGGEMLTRLREAHEYGRSNGVLAVATPTVLESKTSVFSATDAGKIVDVLRKDTPTGNEGSYIVSAYTDDKHVVLTKIDGSAASFVDEPNVQWRFSSLRVETTYEFPVLDTRMQLWVGSNEAQVPYCEAIATPGSQELRGLGAQLYSEFGEIDTASPTLLHVDEEIFTADMVGGTVWVLEKATPTGNEGPHLISGFVDSRNVNVSAAFSADETDVSVAIKTYDGDGYLDATQPEDAEVIDDSGSYSSLDRLKRSMLVNFATEDELDQVGRNVSVVRPVTFRDRIHRRFIKARAYLPATPIYGFETILDALFPQGGWAVYEDLETHPNEVFITLPTQDLGEDPEGRAFMTQREVLTPDTATQVTVTETPVQVRSVLTEPVTQEMDFETLLPSAETPAWAYQNEGAVEGSVFSISGNLLSHVQSSANGGYYKRLVPEIDTYFIEVAAWWRYSSITTVNGRPWVIGVLDGEREYVLAWNDDLSSVVLGQNDGTVVAGPVDMSHLSVGANWAPFRLRREGDYVHGYLAGHDVFGPVAASDFASDSGKAFFFGYFNNATTQSWSALWGKVSILTKSLRDYWNLRVADGTLTSGLTTMLSSSSPWVAGDDDKHVRIRSDNNKHDGLWLAGYIAAGQIDLAGIPLGEATVETIAGEHFITLRDAWLREKDVGKTIAITGSGLGNNVSVEVLEYVSDRVVRTDHPVSGFTAESGLTWEFEPDFDNESNVDWELIGAGSEAAKVLTLREVLPAATSDVLVEYSTGLSAQALANEFVENQGSAGSAPDIYWPFYIFDVARDIQAIIDDVTASGVIPRFRRDY